MKLTLVCGDVAVRLTGVPDDISPERIRDYAAALRFELFAILDDVRGSSPAELPPDPDAA